MTRRRYPLPGTLAAEERDDAFVRWAEEHLPDDVPSDSLEAWDLFEAWEEDAAEYAAERAAEARQEARGW